MTMCHHDDDNCTVVWTPAFPHFSRCIEVNLQLYFYGEKFSLSPENVLMDYLLPSKVASFVRAPTRHQSSQIRPDSTQYR